MDSGLFFHLEIEEISISENKEIYGKLANLRPPF